MTISIYNGVKDNSGLQVNPMAVIDMIKVSGKCTVTGNTVFIDAIIDMLRMTGSAKDRDAIKRDLPAVTWSGHFSKRKASALTDYSDLICLDIDKLKPDQLKVARDLLVQDPFVYFLFTSPSGNGLKIIFKVQGGPECHLRNFLNIEAYFSDRYSLTVDPSGKDVSRLCFLSYDQDAYLNENSTPFVDPGISPDPAPAPPKKKARGAGGPNDKERPGQSLDTLAKFTSQLLKWENGRNNWMHLFACNANRHGFDKGDVLYYVLNNYREEDQKESEIMSTIHSAYKNTAEHGKFKKSNLESKRNVENGHLGDKDPDIKPYGGKSKEPEKEITEDDFRERFQFFDIKWKVENKEDGTTIRKVGGISINYLKFLSILTDLGFRRIDMDKGHYFIHIDDNKIEEVDDVYMKGVFKSHLEQMPQVVHVGDAILHRDMVLNYILGRQAQFFDKNIICHLPRIDMDQVNQDTRETAWFYYTNKCVKITAEGIDLMDYTALADCYVWSDSILTREITLLDSKDQDGNIWMEFLANVCDGDSDRVGNLMRIIGFLMHKYYEGKMKTIVFTDSRVSDDPEGRTGKGLIFKGIKHMMNRDAKTDRGVLCTINGKEFNPDNERRYEKCDINTRVIHINDVRPNYDVERHYNEIEDGITVNKKFQMPFTIHVKIGISTNRTLRLAGGSSMDRFQVVDLSDHYSKDFTPEKEFGKWFFRDFTDREWALFDTFMLNCMRLYLRDGLRPYKSINLENRILHEHVGEDLVNFLDDFPNAHVDQIFQSDFGIIPERKYDKRALYDAFVTICRVDTKKFTQRTFTKKLRLYKTLMDRWLSDVQQKDGTYSQESRSNCKDYIWFAEDPKWKEAHKENEDDEQA